MEPALFLIGFRGGVSNMLALALALALHLTLTLTLTRVVVDHMLEVKQVALCSPNHSCTFLQFPLPVVWTRWLLLLFRQLCLFLRGFGGFLGFLLRYE